MKKLVIATLLAVGSASAFAVDVQSANPTPVNNVVTSGYKTQLSNDSFWKGNDMWPNQFYVGGNLGYSNLRHFNSSSIGGANADNKDFSFGLTAGYQFHKYLALETSFNHLGSYSTAAGDVKANAINLELVGKVPVAYGFSVLGHGGYAYTQAKFQGDTGNRGTPVYGAGVQYDVNKNTAIVAKWDRYQNFGGTDHKLDNYTMGVKYTFN